MVLNFVLYIFNIKFSFFKFVDKKYVASNMQKHISGLFLSSNELKTSNILSSVNASKYSGNFFLSATIRYPSISPIFFLILSISLILYLS